MNMNLNMQVPGDPSMRYMNTGSAPGGPVPVHYMYQDNTHNHQPVLLPKPHTNQQPYQTKLRRLRGITDPFCLGIFITFLVGMCLICGHALLNGLPSRLYRPVNFNGLVCGYDSTVQEMQYLFFPMDPASPKPELLVEDGRCVSFCPGEEDVKAGRTIPITKRTWHPDPEGASVVTIEYQIMTPLYASDVIANSFCIPKDPYLRQQAMSVLRSTWRQTAFAIGGLSSAAPAIFAFILLAAISSLLITWTLRSIPSFTLWVSSFSVIFMCFIGGACLVKYGIQSLRTPEAQLFSLNYTWSTIIGIALLIASVAIAGSIWAAGGLLSNGLRALELAGDVIHDIPNIVILVPILASGVILVWSIIWICITLHVCSLGKSMESWESLPLGRNGGGVFLPLHRPVFYPALSIWSIFYWCLGSCWIMEYIVALCQFAIAYTGTVWYFSPSVPGTEGRQRDVGWMPSFFAIGAGLRYHSGSFALGGLVMGLSRIVRVFFCWAASKHRSPEGIVGFLHGLFGFVSTPVQNLVDTFTPAGYVEMALSAPSFLSAMDTASKKTRGIQSPSAALSGVATIISWIISGSISLFFGLVSHYYFSHAKIHTASDSAYFISSPLFCSLVTGVFTAYIASLFTNAWDVTADSVLYSFAVDAAELTPEDGQYGAPPQLRNALLKYLEESELATRR